MLAPEQSLLNAQYVQLLQRVAFQDGNNTTPVTTAIAASSTQAAGTNGITVPIPPGQAIRVARASAEIYDAAQTGFLTVQSAAIAMFGQAGGNAFVGAFASQTGAFVLGGNGLYLSAVDEELILFNDYLEEGGIPPGIQFIVAADVSNSDAAAAQTVSAQMSLLIEFYLLRQGIGSVGFAGFKAE